jgi:hypothetical protein
MRLRARDECSPFPTNGVAVVPTSGLPVKMTVILRGRMRRCGSQEIDQNPTARLVGPGRFRGMKQLVPSRH